MDAKAEIKNCLEWKLTDINANDQILLDWLQIIIPFVLQSR